MKVISQNLLTSRTSRQKIKAGLGLIVLLVGLGLGSFSFLAQAASPQTYTQLRLLMEALHNVDNKYVREKKNTDLIYGAIRGMVRSLDPSSSFLTPAEYLEMLAGKKSPAGEVGLELTLKEKILTVVAPLEGGPAWGAGIKAGDHILKINNKSVRNLTPLEAAKRLQGPPGSTVKLQVLRNGMIKPQDLTITRAELDPVSVTSQILEDDYIYLRLKYFTDQTRPELARVLKSLPQHRPTAKGLILDLRNTARGTLEQAIAAASTFVGDSMVFYTKERDAQEPQPYYGQKKWLALRNKIPVVVLVDGGTAKAAEILAGALQNHRQAILLGSKTFGNGSVSKVIPLKDGSALILTVAYCYTPEGKLIQGKGLTPDVTKKITKASATAPIKVTPEVPKLNAPKAAQELIKDPWVAQALQLLKQGGEPRPGPPPAS